MTDVALFPRSRAFYEHMATPVRHDLDRLGPEWEDAAQFVDVSVISTYFPELEREIVHWRRDFASAGFAGGRPPSTVEFC